MPKYSPVQIENMTINGEKRSKISEPVGGKGDGTLVFKKQKSAVEAYFRYRDGAKDSTLFIGRYSKAGKEGFTLTEIRDKAREYARLRREIAPVDLKEHLKLEEARRLKEVAEQKRQAEIEASRGTLEDLCNLYVASLYRRQAASARDVEYSIKRNIIKPFPNLASQRANTMTPDDLIPLFQRLLERGVTRTYNIVRSNLKAAFNLGMQSDHDPRQQLEHGKRFSIQFNPVDAIPRYAEFDRVRKRTLSNDELYQMWHYLESGKQTWSPLYGLLLRFCLACFGNRPEQLNDIKWSDIDLAKRSLKFVDTKGKNATPKERVIPLTNRALALLEQAQAISGSFEGPFIITGESTIDIRNLGRFVAAYNDWLQDEAIAQGKKPPERFTAKDLRRTAARLFTDCRVPQEHRYLLQSREDGSVESKHYLHDDRLPEKRDFAKVYDDYLGRIIEGTANEEPDNVIQFKATVPSIA